MWKECLSQIKENYEVKENAFTAHGKADLNIETSNLLLNKNVSIRNMFDIYRLYT